MATAPKAGSTPPPYRLHWHVLITHFPLSFFVAAFGFQILHLFTKPECYEEATNISLIAATVVMIPTLLSGWFTWKKEYHGAQVQLFQRKILIAFIMQGFSIILVAWRMSFMGIFNNTTSPAHWVYLAGNILLMAGASAEGYYGGRLNHR